MNKNDFVDIVAEKSGLTKKDSKAALDAVLETITETLAKGDSISFIGFGTFSVGTRKAREGVNPSTGARIQIAETKSAKFKVGAKLKDAVK